MGYQCSDTHLGFLKHWFSQDEKALKKLEVCVSIPETATERFIFDEITIETDEDQHIITVTSKVIVVNMRESKSWQYTQTDTFALRPRSRQAAQYRRQRSRGTFKITPAQAIPLTLNA